MTEERKEKKMLKTPDIIHKQYQRNYTTTMLDEDFAKRVIYLNEEISFENANVIEKQISFLNGLDPEAEIVLKITSPGGVIDAGMVILDAMKLSSAPITTVAIGLAASMGAMIFAAGDKRVMYPSAKVMIHDPLAYGIQGSALEIQQASDSIMKTRKKMAKILSERTGQPINKIYQATERSTYFSAEEAVQFGIADEIADHLY